MTTTSTPMTGWSRAAIITSAWCCRDAGAWLWDIRRMTPLIIVGCGYIGTRIARTALAAGRTVRVCGRSTGRLAALTDAGAQVKYLDATVPKQLSPVLSGLQG